MCACRTMCVHQEKVLRSKSFRSLAFGHTQKSTLSAARDDAAQCYLPSRYRKRNWWPLKLQRHHQKEERISSPVLGPPEQT